MVIGIDSLDALIKSYGPGLVLATAIVVLWRMALRIHDDKTAPNVDFRHLIVNRHGRTDLFACSYLAVVGSNLWVMVACTLIGKVPDGLSSLIGSIDLFLLVPLTAKVIFGAKTMPALPGSAPSPPEPTQ